MFKILTLNKIASCGTDQLPKETYAISSDEKNPDGIILRSADMHGMEVPESLLAVARAGAGVNNIPVDDYAAKGIVVFNSPGANANAVKELVVAALLISSRDIVGGVEWARGLAGSAGVAEAVEKGKAAFIGPEIMGKKLGVIGLGAVGGLVANAGHALGMEVYGIDPFMSVDAAWNLSRSIHRAATNDEIFEKCDYITLHAPATAENKKMLNDAAFAKMKDGVRIINTARADLVDLDAMKRALESGKVAKYVTDFPTDEAVGVKGVIPIPHLGASTPESEDNCAIMAAAEIREFLECGVIRNSVNFPNCDLHCTTDVRVAIIHKNIPNIIGPLTTAFAKQKINIENMMNKSKGNYAYTIIDAAEAPTEAILAELKAVEGVIRIRVIK
ncbi:MAG: phosphoglycerate dehydrogenase [Firmicutes bacterium]|nr:phosphoglycerate dehydrogenase [Bacillota bacterium]